MDEKKNSDETLDGVKTGTEEGAGKLEDLIIDVDTLADQAVADASENKAADGITSEDPTGPASGVAETVKDAASDKAETVADAAADKAETVKDAVADKAESVEDAAVSGAAGTVTGTTEAAAGAADTAKDAAADKAEKIAKDTAQKTADSAKDATTAVKDETARKKPVAKVDPKYDKIFWPPAGRVWSNTLTVIIVAALMAGTIFLVDLGLRAIIDGFMSI